MYFSYFNQFESSFFEFFDPKNGGIPIFTIFLSPEIKKIEKTTKSLMCDSVKLKIFI